MTETIDIAIIGAGPGGVYAGWRLLTGERHPNSIVHQNGLRVRLYEGSDRLGGRLQSIIPPGAPNLRAEFGGMGYNTHNRITRPLIEDVLCLPTVPFPTGSNHNLNYLRGVRYTMGDYASNPDRIPYMVNEDERGKNFALLIYGAASKIIPNFTTLTSAEWGQLKRDFRFEGKPLYEIGFWNLLKRLMSDEAYALVAEAGGQFSFVGNWNAAEALEWYLSAFKPNAQYRTMTDGYDKLVYVLHDQFTSAGGETRLNCALRAIETAEDNRLLLTFSDDSTVIAGSVILAMPRRSLEIIAPRSIILNEPSVQRLVQTVTPIPVMKIFMTYPEAWWEKLNIADGRSVTDLPLRVTYYIGSEKQHGDGQNRTALLMASYNDTRYTEFWQGLRFGAVYADKPNPFTTTTDPAWVVRRGTQAMADELHRQLALLHGLDDIPEPYSIAYQDWSDDPYGGAWNAWKVGVKAWEVIPQMIQPDPQMPLYICGSAYSNWQGWVEGALQTAEQVVNRLGIAYPAWIIPD